METKNKFIKKALTSFKDGKFYQAEREFTSGLLRDIESKSYASIELSFTLILPILEEHSLYHESEQLMLNYLQHLRKHKDIVEGIKPVTKVLKANIVTNDYPNTTVHFLNAFLDFSTNSQEQELITFIEGNALSFIETNKEFSLNNVILEKFFDSLILLSMFETLEPITEDYYLKKLDINNSLTYILYSMIILAINGKNEKAADVLKKLRKETPIKMQKESDLFQCCSEFLLASSSKDYEWVKELQQHFSETLKEKTVKILIINLIKKFFPDETKVSLFDIFKI